MDVCHKFPGINSNTTCKHEKSVHFLEDILLCNQNAQDMLLIASSLLNDVNALISILHPLLDDH